MNSLVVLLSVVALAAAKPSQFFDAGVVAYATPIIAAGPAAVSHQSRLDIKTSPAIVETAAYAPITTHTVIAEPTLFAAPAFTAPAAVSSQSRIDIKSTPGIINTVVAPGALAYSAPIATAAIAQSLVKTALIAPGITTDAVSPVFLKSLVPEITGPAVIKSASFVPAAIEAPAVTLDTAEVTVARDSSFEDKANSVIDTPHVLKKRSAPVIVPAPVLSYASPHFISTYGASPLTYAAPVNPIITKGYSLHAW